MKLNRPSKSLISALLIVSIAVQPLTASAALHPLSVLTTDSPTLQTLDLVTNTHWDYDAKPAVTSGGGVALDRAFITAAYTQFAKSLHIMTEGRHRIGTVYVYNNGRFNGTVDARLFSRADSSGILGGGWGKREGTMNIAIDSMPAASAQSNSAKLAIEVGQNVAAVSAIYVYGLMAEYQDIISRSPHPANPQATDTPLNTIMNDPAKFVSFSTPGDITDATQTVHRRIYGASAWETLARPASADPAQAAEFARTAFAAFAGYVPKNSAALIRPQSGWEGVKVVFVDNPREHNVFVLSRSLNSQAFTASQHAIVQSLRQMPLSPNSLATVLSYGGNAAPQTALPITAITSEAARDAAIASVDAITRDAQGASLDDAMGAALDDIDRHYKANRLTLGDAVNVNLFPREQDDVSAANKARTRALRLTVNANLLTGDSTPAAAGIAALSADRTKDYGPPEVPFNLVDWIIGLITKKPRGSAMVAGAVKAQAASVGATTVTLAEDHVDRLVVGTPFVLKTPVLAKTDGKLSFTANWESSGDSAKIRFELTAPNGSKFTPTNPLVNQSFGSDGYVKYVMNADAASAHFEVDSRYAAKSGTWTSTLSAGALIASSVDLYSEADSLLRAVAAVRGNGTSSPVITVTVGTDRALQGAIATAYVYDGNGALKLTQVLKDDGTAGDARPDDGVYSASLAGRLPAGEYDVEVDVTQSASGARLAVSGSSLALTPGAQRPAAEPLGGAFSRSAETLMRVAPTTVVEYFVPALKKYFITGRDNEKAALAQYPDTYRPTGMSFVAGPGLAPPTGTQPICRFYFASPLANTHFYGGPADCALVGNAFKGNIAVTNEGVDFAIAVPDSAGNCPATAPAKVYRSFNNRSAQNDGNHRYSVSLVRYSQMSVLGWASEGTVFCAASVTDATAAPQ